MSVCPLLPTEVLTYSVFGAYAAQVMNPRCYLRLTRVTPALRLVCRGNCRGTVVGHVGGDEVAVSGYLRDR